MMEKRRKMSKTYYFRQIVACLIVYCILLAVPAQVAMANPDPPAGVGPSVGDYTSPTGLALPGVNTTTIIAPDNGTVFDWENFDIGFGHTVDHLMAANHAVLHRINVTSRGDNGDMWGDGAATGINGNLNAPGYLFVVNPMGIVIGPQAFIQAQRFVASGLKISNFDEFINNTANPKVLQFDGYATGTLGVVNNSNNINVAEAVALVGKTVTNNGTITSDSVVLAAGEKVYLAVTEGGSNLAVDVTDLSTTPPGDHTVTNNGTIAATDGNVLLAAGDIYSNAISGVENLAAKSNGNIVLDDLVDGDFSADNMTITGDFDDSGAGNVDINTGVNITGGTFTSKGVDFDNTGGIITTNDGKVDIQNTGNVTIGAAIDAGAGDVDIDGGDTGVATSITGGGTITSSGTLNLEASGSIGGAGAAINTATGTINASSTVAGDIYIENDGTVTLTDVSTADGGIDIRANSGDIAAMQVHAGGNLRNLYLGTFTSGDITVDSVSAGGDLITIYSAGAIREYGSGDSGADITAETLNLMAHEGKGIGTLANPIETAAYLIYARNYDSTVAGDIVLDNYNLWDARLIASNSSVGSIVFNHTGDSELTLQDVKTSDGLIDISADNGNIVASLVNAGGAGDVELTTTTSGDVIVDDVKAIDNKITINSAGAIKGFSVPTIFDPHLTADTLDLTANDGIGSPASDYIQTAANTIIARTDDDTKTSAHIRLINDNSSDTSLTASTVGTDSWVRFSQRGGGELTLKDVTTVDGSIVIEAKEGDIVAKLVNAGGLYGDVYLDTYNDSGDVYVDDVKALENQITINSVGAILEYGDDDDADLTADTLMLTANDGIGEVAPTLYPIETAATTINAHTIDGTKSKAHIILDNDNSLPTSLNASTVGTDSRVRFSQRGGGELTLKDVSTVDGLITIDAYSGDIVATLVNADDQYVPGNWVRFAGTTHDSGDITVGSVTAADGVDLTSAGSINDAEDDKTVDITTHELWLAARDEIGGSPKAGKTNDTLGAIETDVDVLLAWSWGTGGEGGGGDIVIVEKDNVELSEVWDESGSIFLEATNGGMTHLGGTTVIGAGGGTLTLVQQDDLDLAGFTFENQATTDLMVEITDGGFTTVDTANGGNDDNAADQWQSIQAIATGNIVLQGSDPEEDIKIGLHEGYEPISHPFGGGVASWGGGVSIISENSAVRTADNTILDDVEIWGFSDDELGIGVDLPYGPGKAAIVIMSEDTLTLGENTELTASGWYDTTGDVDDREGVGFLDVRDEIPSGYPRYEGGPFDAAIYLASTGGDVEVSSLVSITSYEKDGLSNGLSDGLPDGLSDGYRNGLPEASHVGAMIIDAFDSVTFGEAPGSPFEVSLENGDVGDRLEVVSRITEWLFQAEGRLPYPSYPYNGVGPFPSDYTYVLRGAGLENPAITDGRAWVLVDPDNAPLDREAGEQAQRLTLGLDGCPVLIAAASAELGIPEETIEVSLANSYALNTDIQPCESCARLLDAAVILRDEDGSRMAAMNQVFNALAPSDAPLTPEVIASIVTAFAGHVNDGTQYATAIEYIDAFVQYIAVLSSDIGSPVGDSVAYVMEKYGSGVTGTDNANLAAFVASRLESGEMFGN